MDGASRSSPSSSSDTDGPIAAILSWSRTANITLDSNLLALRALPGRGLGFVAVRPIPVDAVLLKVPASALHTARRVPAETRRALRWHCASKRSGSSVHGLLAADLWLRPNWNAAARRQMVAAEDEADDGGGDGGRSGLRASKRRRKSQRLSQPSAQQATGPVKDRPLSGQHGPALPDPWAAVLPTQSELFAAMPLLWPEALRRLLPPAAGELVRKQGQKLATDWGVVREALGERVKGYGGDGGVTEKADWLEDEARSAAKPSAKARSAAAAARDAYTYAWLLVNTRTFYYLHPTDSESGPSQVARDDRMALQPIADLFNHHGVAPSPDARMTSVTFDSDGFTIRSSRPYEAGEEVCISYGAHGNDFLLAEYGFVLPDGENEFDEVSLDEDVVLPRLSPGQRAELEAAGFLGGYVLDARTPACYRTEMALRLMCCEAGDEEAIEMWRARVRGEVDDDDSDGVDGGGSGCSKWKRTLADMLRAYLDTIDARLAAVDAAATLEDGAGGSPEQRDMLRRRWRQIRRLVEGAIVQLVPDDAAAVDSR